MRFTNFANASIATESENFLGNDSGNWRHLVLILIPRARAYLFVADYKHSESKGKRATKTEKRYLLLLRWISFHGILSNSIQSSPLRKALSVSSPSAFSLPFFREPFLRLRFLRLYLNSLWRKLLICFIACGSYSETWGKGFFVPSSQTRVDVHITPVLTVGNVAIQVAIHMHIHSCALISFCVYNAPGYVRNPHRRPLTISSDWQFFSTGCHVCPRRRLSRAMAPSIRDTWDITRMSFERRENY